MPSPRNAIDAEVFPRFDVEVWEGGPMLDVMGATVDAAVRGGAQVLVIVAPIPWRALQRAGLYERSRYEQRIEIARETVERNGGRLLDLHRLLRRREFRDLRGHYNAAGTKKISTVLIPEVRKLMNR